MLIAVAFALASVLAVIYLFLGNVRATLIPAVTIPVSIVASLTVMYALGYSINVLTLLGLVLAIGLVVDDAIVVLENVHRRHELGEPPLVAAITGTREIGFAVIATTLTLISVFVPISFLPGDLGRLFREFGFTLAAAVAFSALIALTLTPMLASRLPEHEHRNRFAAAMDRFFKQLASFYERCLRVCVGRPWSVVAVLAVLIGVGVVTFLLRAGRVHAASGQRPRVHRASKAPEGSSFEYIDRYARQLEAIALKAMEDGEVAARARARAGPRRQRPAHRRRQHGARVPDLRRLGRARAHGARDHAARARRGAQAARRARVDGPCPAAWAAAACNRRSSPSSAGPTTRVSPCGPIRCCSSRRRIPGLANVQTNYKERKPQIRVSIDRNRAADLGISLESVGRTLETVLGSRIVTTYIDRGREYNVILQGRDEIRETTTDLDEHPRALDAHRRADPAVERRAARGNLGHDAARAVRPAARDQDLGRPRERLHDGRSRAVVRGRRRARAAAEATLDWDGQTREFTRTGQQLYFTFLLALAVVYLVLAAQFESFVHPIIIMVTVPLALLGAVFGLKLFGLTINIFSQIAVIMLIGIAAKNGVLIVEFANQLRDRGVEFVDAIVQAAVTRLRPVLMTSLCTAFGALPLMLATGAGAEQRRPIGIVVFFGMTVAVFLTLFAVPTVYALLARKTRSPQHVSRLVDRLMGGASVASGGAAVHEPRRED